MKVFGRFLTGLCLMGGAFMVHALPESPVPAAPSVLLYDAFPRFINQSSEQKAIRVAKLSIEQLDDTLHVVATTTLTAIAEVHLKIAGTLIDSDPHLLSLSLRSLTIERTRPDGPSYHFTTAVNFQANRREFWALWPFKHLMGQPVEVERVRDQGVDETVYYRFNHSATDRGVVSEDEKELIQLAIRCCVRPCEFAYLGRDIAGAPSSLFKTVLPDGSSRLRARALLEIAGQLKVGSAGPKYEIEPASERGQFASRFTTLSPKSDSVVWGEGSVTWVGDTGLDVAIWERYLLLGESQEVDEVKPWHFPKRAGLILEVVTLPPQPQR